MVMLFERFTEYLSSSCRVKSPGKILLAISGGIDSVVMMHLFQRTGLFCEVAHCNFQLRGDDSAADEKFVHAALVF